MISGAWALSASQDVSSQTTRQTRGGAVALTELGQTGQAIFEECAFVDNAAGMYGGAVYANAARRLTFKHCRFSGNTAAGGGHHLFVKATKESMTIHDCSFDSSTTADTSASDGEQVMLETITTLADFDGCRFKSPKAGQKSVVLRTNSPAHELKLRNTSMHFSNGALLDVKNHILRVETSTFKGNGTVNVAKGTDVEVVLNSFAGVDFFFPAIRQDSKVQFRNNVNATAAVVVGSLRHCDAAKTGVPAGCVFLWTLQ